MYRREVGVLLVSFGVEFQHFLASLGPKPSIVRHCLAPAWFGGPHGQFPALSSTNLFRTSDPSPQPVAGRTSPWRAHKIIKRRPTQTISHISQQTTNLNQFSKIHDTARPQISSSPAPPQEITLASQAQTITQPSSPSTTSVQPGPTQKITQIYLTPKITHPT